LIRPSRARTASSGQDGTRIWAGRITDPFYVDLALTGTINAAVKNGTAADWSAWRAEDAQNSLADRTVESIVLEVSHEQTQPAEPGGARMSWRRRRCSSRLPSRGAISRG
jgi:hypothetical protein